MKSAENRKPSPRQLYKKKLFCAAHEECEESESVSTATTGLTEAKRNNARTEHTNKEQLTDARKRNNARTDTNKEQLTDAAPMPGSGTTPELTPTRSSSPMQLNDGSLL
ncbi:hypothetical protein NDU88_000893 [Pleurodeles waltl]|uniref:Uncharacterized protein n=1 Tax=Pleurodeles waltl TaxID=8319 RepID=A0AAV7TGT7_PLEWA|nr:hypothetical protein NDU88_000893 [Pleurodeles waltl]